MKRLVLLLLLSSLLSAAFGQTPWATVAGAPDYPNNYSSFGGSVLYLNAPSVNAVWALASVIQSRGPGVSTTTGTVIRSIDNGLTWQTSSTTYTADAHVTQQKGTLTRDLSALDAQQAWAITFDVASGTTAVQRTTTGPTGFTTVASSLPEFASLHFFTATTGIAVANMPATGATTWPFYRSTDGGVTWVPVANAPAVASGGFESIVAKNTVGSVLWLTSSTGAALRTTDAGLTWTATPNLGQVAFADALHGLAYYSRTSTTQQQLARTADGGQTWVAVVFSGQPIFGAITAIPGQPGTYVSAGYTAINTAAGVAYRGVSAISRDAGNSWQILSDTDESFSLLAASSASQLWAGSTATGVPGVPSQHQLLRYTGTALATQAGGSPAAQLVGYPNPTTGLVQLAGPLPSQETVQVYDAAGRLCQQASVTETQRTIDLSAQVPGLYQVVVTAASGAVRRQRISKLP